MMYRKCASIIHVVKLPDLSHARRSARARKSGGAGRSDGNPSIFSDYPNEVSCIVCAHIYANAPRRAGDGLDALS